MLWTIFTVFIIGDNKITRSKNKNYSNLISRKSAYTQILPIRHLFLYTIYLSNTMDTLSFYLIDVNSL